MLKHSTSGDALNPPQPVYKSGEEPRFRSDEIQANVSLLQESDEEEKKKNSEVRRVSQ